VGLLATVIFNQLVIRRSEPEPTLQRPVPH